MLGYLVIRYWKAFLHHKSFKTTNNFIDTILIIIIVLWDWCLCLTKPFLSINLFANHKFNGSSTCEKISNFIHNYPHSYSMGSEISPPQSRQSIHMFRRWFTLALGWVICGFAKCHRHGRHQQELPPQQYWQWSWHWWRIWQLKSLAVCGCNKT